MTCNVQCGAIVFQWLDYMQHLRYASEVLRKADSFTLPAFRQAFDALAAAAAAASSVVHAMWMVNVRRHFDGRAGKHSIYMLLMLLLLLLLLADAGGHDVPGRC